MNNTIIESKKNQSWNDSFLIGISVVDKQHKRLIDLFDEIISVSNEDYDEDRILLLLNELQRYTIYHFNTEEELMRQANFQNTEMHLKQHNLFKKKIGDFMIDEKYIFEIGGSGKGYNQIANKEHSYLALDEMQKGVRNKIPLWLFGFIY